jgi:hypothetical protein
MSNPAARATLPRALLVIAVFMGVGVAGVWLTRDEMSKPASPSIPVLARVRTTSGGVVTGTLLPMPDCPEEHVCADPDDYQD